MTSEDPGDSVAAAQGEHEDDLRAAVTANPMDYNTWTKLIGLVEQKQDIFKIREVYDAFLTEFPLCFGYWKKYAIHEQHNGDFQKGKEVFERGIASAGRDCNMWAQYASNMVTKSEDPEHVRSVFERAAEAVGLDYNSNTIWDMYLDFEKTRGDILRVSKLYRRIIQIPLGQVQRYTNEFKKWTDQYTLTQLLDEKELQQLDESLQATTAQPPAPPEENGTEGAEKPAAEGTIEPIKKSEKKRKREWIAGLIKAANERIEFARQRKGFEDKIKRPYFHFKPLDAAQLENWRKYLAFEMRAQPPDRARVQRLFERCLIACYNYVEFWLRFARFLEKNPDDPNGVHIACSVLEAAASGPLKRNPSIFIALASSYEARGQIDLARAMFDKAQFLAESLVEVYVRRAQFERRHTSLSTACAVISVGLSKCVDEMSVATLNVHHARLLATSPTCDKAQVIQLLKSAAEAIPDSAQIWFEYLQAVSEGDPGNQTARGVFDAVLSKGKIDKSDAATLSRWYADQVVYGCNDVAWVREVEQRVLVECTALAGRGTKRSADSSADTAAPSKKQRLNTQTTVDPSQWYYAQQQAVAAAAAAAAAAATPTSTGASPVPVPVPAATDPAAAYASYYASFGAAGPTPAVGGAPATATPAAYFPQQYAGYFQQAGQAPQ